MFYERLHVTFVESSQLWWTPSWLRNSPATGSTVFCTATKSQLSAGAI